MEDDGYDDDDDNDDNRDDYGGNKWLYHPQAADFLTLRTLFFDYLEWRELDHARTHARTHLSDL